MFNVTSTEIKQSLIIKLEILEVLELKQKTNECFNISNCSKASFGSGHNISKSQYIKIYLNECNISQYISIYQ